MQMHIKLYLIGCAFILGGSFMVFFPPRNFAQSGGRVRKVRSIDEISKITNDYFNYTKFLDIAEDLAQTEPELVKLIYLTPRTSENRSLIALELKSDLNTKKPGILVIGALDAMIWGAPNAIMELAFNLMHNENYQVPLFNDYDWYLIPMANPDGIEMTRRLQLLPMLNVSDWSYNKTFHATHRPSEWHKNVQSDLEEENCFGININRNFAYHWQDGLSQTPDKCSQFYTGHKPFSAAESQAIQKYIDTLGDIVNLAIHLDGSRNQKKEFLLYPWRYSQRALSNADILQEIGEYAARQSRLPDGRLYEVHQSSSNLEGRVAGSLTDYLTGVVGIELVYLFKPYHPLFPNISDSDSLHVYKAKARNIVTNLVRAWRSTDKMYTLSFFGTIIEY